MCEAFVNGFQSKHPEGEIVIVHLYDYTFKGCISCFSCKLKEGKSYGRCCVQDELASVLQIASTADCLVIASPIYLMDVTGAMKSFLERLCFPFGSYEHGYRSLAPKKMRTVRNGFVPIIHINLMTTQSMWWKYFQKQKNSNTV